MKPVFLLLAVLFLAASCRKQPATQSGTNPPPATPDGTEGWRKSNPGLGAVINFYFLTPATGFSAGANGIYRTLDSGKTWVPVEATLKGGSDIFFYDQQHGYAITSNHLGVTSDGGATWHFKPLDFLGHDLARVFFSSVSTGFITTRQGLYKTTDGGVTWAMVNGMECTGIYFKNEHEGWIGAKSNSNPGLFKTTDGGLTFERVPGTGGDAYTILFTDSLHGWATSEHSGGPWLFRTADGGATWDHVPVAGAVDMQFLNNTVGYMATGESIIKTTDGGNTWKEVLKINETTGIIEMFFVDENNGWSQDSEGVLYRWHKP